ncbi:MAG: ABC transporter permease [Anaerolineales bacterium]|nr:ABC transporter permease [Anaerolineales bacterium]
MSAEIEGYQSPKKAPTATSSGLLGRVRELYEYRYLLQNLVVRDLKVRYKNSFLGIVWSLLNPLLMMVVFSLVFSRFGGTEIRQYAVFFLVGLMPWNFFSGALLTGTTSITNSSGIIKKVYFPRELLPLSAILSNLVNFGFTLIVLLVFLYGSGLGLTVHALWIPVIIVTQIIFTLGLAMFLGAINVFYRDVLMILDVVMLAWFFLTPIMYPFELFNDMSPIIIGELVLEPARVMRWINPMASIIDGYRTVLWGTMTSDGPVSMYPPYLLRTFVTSVIVFVVGYVTFMRLHSKFGEKL